MKALVIGTGKMGRAIETALVARGHESAPLGRGDTIVSVSSENRVDLGFEFTTPQAARGRVAELLVCGIPVVSGTTGWDPEPMRQLAREQRVAFLYAPNFSIGVAVLKHAAALAARELARFPEFEAGIVERHHSAKVDAPSGTAAALAASIAEASGRTPPVVSLRQGGQPGEHAVYFEGAEESLELVHRARSRTLFARGAVLAGEWLVASGVRGPVSFEDFFQGRHV